MSRSWWSNRATSGDRAVLAKIGVTQVEGVGARFNPEKHQAVTMEASPDAEEGTVLRVFQKGYVLNERLVRPAMVVVAKAPGC